VLDLALLLSVQAGHDARAPLSQAGDGSVFTASLEADVRGQRVGWLGDLDGYLPMEAGVLDVSAQALRRLQTLGCQVEPAQLGLAPERVWQAWLVWRQALVGARIAPYLAKEENRARIKPEALWEHAQSLQLTGAQLMAASAERTLFYQRMRALFEQYDVLALPAAQVWPFDARERWPREIAGRAMDTYHRWMEVVIYATFAGLPCISVPAGFSPEGWPMGVQLIGRPRGDFALLQLAHAYEQAAQEVLTVKPKTG
jgi:amidase